MSLLFLGLFLFFLLLFLNFGLLVHILLLQSFLLLLLQQQYRTHFVNYIGSYFVNI